ncbi:MAG: dTDP-glucose 4,6-dehydratase [Anaerolineae bacterium]|nr:dTDP-glucose 4,6-dehydratase [Anaerolineae bacterium]
MKNLLITGGAGFIGSNFAHYILQKYPDYRVVVFDKLTYAGNLDNLRDLEGNPRYTFVWGDICDAEAVDRVMRAHDIDTIVNFAAETHVDRSIMEADAFIKTDVYGTYVLLEAARRYGGVRYHQVSTDEVYGEVLEGRSKEDDPLRPRSPYAASKAGAEHLVAAYHVTYGLPTTVTRGSNNIGPYQYPEKVVPLFITNAIDDMELPLYGDGLQMRDYQYVLDHCEGIDVVLHKGVPGEVYNLGSGVETRNIDMARLILRLLGKPESLIRHVTDRPGHDRRYALDCSKIMALGWRPRHTFEEALEKTVRWYVENEWWWRKIKSGEYLEYYRKWYVEREKQARG